MKIKVAGTEYEFPSIDSITWDESILLERYAGVGIEELIPGEKMPMGAVKAFVVIAVMRREPQRPEREIADSIGKMKLGELEGLITEDEASPPVQTPTESGDSTTTSGTDGNDPSKSSLADVTPLVSGVQDSGTGSTSVQETSVG